MKRISLFSPGVLIFLMVLTLPVHTQANEQDNEHLSANLKNVKIGRSAVLPEILVIKSEEGVSWTNYAGTPVEVRFSKGTAQKILCKEPSPFHAEEDGAFTSGELRASEFATLCHFMPGEYEYTVTRTPGPGFPRGGTMKSTGKLSVTQ